MFYLKISTKGRYGIRLMLYLAVHYPNGHIPLKEIARNQEISEKYLEQIINPLTKAGFVHSFRGAQGGYSLTSDPRQITVGSILRVLEGSLCPVECLENKSCQKSDSCASILLWRRIKDAIDQVVDTVTLADLAEDYLKKNQPHHKNDKKERFN